MVLRCDVTSSPAEETPPMFIGTPASPPAYVKNEWGDAEVHNYEYLYGQAVGRAFDAARALGWVASYEAGHHPYDERVTVTKVGNMHMQNVPSPGGTATTAAAKWISPRGQGNLLSEEMGAESMLRGAEQPKRVYRKWEDIKKARYPKGGPPAFTEEEMAQMEQASDAEQKVNTNRASFVNPKEASARALAMATKQFPDSAQSCVDPAEAVTAPFKVGVIKPAANASDPAYTEFMKTR